jgi:small multidrug resistance pump
MPAGVLLTLAILAEVIGTVALRESDGFSRPWPSAVMAIAYLASFWLLALTLRHIPLSVTYAVWSAVGTAAIAAIGIAAFGESLNALKLASLTLIIAGVIGLNLAGASH